MPTTIKWDGLDEFKRQLRNLPEHLADEAADPVEAAGEQTKSSLIQSYPLGPTGNLRSRVTVTTERSAFGVTSTVKSASPHAHLWDFGTKSRRTRKGWNRGVSPEHKQDGIGPIATRNRARMYDQLRGILRTAGFEVDG